MKKQCIGLFGTCGSTTWRKDILIPAYESIGLKDGEDFFNPQVDDWKPELAEIEADHLSNDQVILFPITGETYGSGSLSEVGFSILNAIKLDDRRDFVIYVEGELDDSLMEENPALAKESLRSRALIKQHLSKLNFSNIYVISSETPRDEALRKMLAISVDLLENAKKAEKLKRMCK